MPGLGPGAAVRMAQLCPQAGHQPSGQTGGAGVQTPHTMAFSLRTWPESPGPGHCPMERTGQGSKSCPLPTWGDSCHPWWARLLEALLQQCSSELRAVIFNTQRSRTLQPEPGRPEPTPFPRAHEGCSRTSSRQLQALPREMGPGSPPARLQKRVSQSAIRSATHSPLGRA